MNTELLIAGVSSFVLAVGHAATGMRSVLPNLKKQRSSNQAQGLSATTVGMLRFSWHVVTLLLLAFAGSLISLAWAPHANANALLLRWFAALWLAIAVLAMWSARRRPTWLLRRPVPVLNILIAVMLVKAST